MTSAFIKRKSNRIIGFKIDGHSGYAEENEDIVCSAISAITQTIIIGITEVLKLSVNYYIEDGFLELDLDELNSQDIDRCQILLETMYLGLKSMEISYGDYIKVIEEEV